MKRLEHINEAPLRGPQLQKGVATLMAAVILLIVVTLGALMVARSAFFEQQISGADLRNKEVYTSAQSGLEYGIKMLELNAQVWSDLDADGEGEVGDMAYPPVADNSVQGVDSYSFVDGAGTSTISYELKTDADEAISVVEVSSATTAVGDSHVQKTVRILAMQASLLEPSIIDGPPLVVEDCLPFGANVVGGTPNVYPGRVCELVDPSDEDSGCKVDGSGNVIYTGEYEPSIASVNTNEDEDCVHEGHLEAFDENGDPIAGDVEKAYAKNDVDKDFYSSFFSMSPAALRSMSHSNPASIIYVDAEYQNGPDSQHAYPFNGNAWHQSLGSNSTDADGNYDDQVILFFSKEVGCPPISGGAGSPNVVIYGLVFYEQEDCDLSGWGNAIIYGTLAVSGDLAQFNANVELHDMDLDTFDGENDPFSFVSLIPGTWRDF